MSDKKSNPPWMSEILDIHKKLHEGKIFAHWLWVAIQRVVAGEPIDEVMADYGYYKKNTGELLHVIESSIQIAKVSNPKDAIDCNLINHLIQFNAEDDPNINTKTMEYRIIIEARTE